MDHVLDFYNDLFSKEDWIAIQTLDNLEFPELCVVDADWLENDFEEEEVNEVVFTLGRDKAPGPDGFPLAFL